MAEAASDPLRNFKIFDLSEPGHYQPQGPGTPQEGEDICTEAELRDRTWTFRSIGRAGQNTAPRTCAYQEAGAVCARHIELGRDDTLRVSLGSCLLADPDFISDRFPGGLPDGLPTFEMAQEIQVDDPQ